MTDVFDRPPDDYSKSRGIQITMIPTEREGRQPEEADGRLPEQHARSSSKVHDGGHCTEAGDMVDWSREQAIANQRNDKHENFLSSGGREDALPFACEEDMPEGGLQAHDEADNRATEAKLGSSLSSFSSLEEAFLTSLDVISSLRDAVTLLLRAQGVPTEGEGRHQQLNDYEQNVSRKQAMDVMVSTGAFSCHPQAYESLLKTGERTKGGKRLPGGESPGIANCVGIIADEHMSREEHAGAVKADRREHPCLTETVQDKISSSRHPAGEQERRRGTLECCTHSLNSDYELSICKALLMLQHIGGPEESKPMGVDPPLGGFPLLSQERGSFPLGVVDDGGPAHLRQGRQRSPELEPIATQPLSQHLRTTTDGAGDRHAGAEACCSSFDQLQAMRIRGKAGDGAPASDLGLSFASFTLDKMKNSVDQSETKKHVRTVDLMQMLLKVRLLRQAHLLLRADVLVMRKQQGLQQERLNRALQAAVKRHESERDSLLCRLQKLASLLQKK
ncbi:hypothetical protein TGME49_271600 [Toxoplasma gondii ME49]|uniref:Uncharacterized protein n=1 Tax=Toxoplasma gondii (strain ATCC 50611 / Me49) TaxID=508771 RepID=S8G9T3_TOXGM|nr:hypothetical protein TGME49_271600 [Toxoplasma gondii ME49]EPT28525.1 hypothetical protein TGME49_271600 [Toxoplasma gondii ME49]|eukprot:XP_018636661.1 hypothetical protein TGME49_271600 [Toxoplasma gondii ME49]